MAKWFSDGSLVVEVVDRLGAHQALSVEMYYDTNLKKDLLKLIVPKDFTTYTTAEKDEDIMLEKYMVLYHEYIHLKNHFNGIWPIMGQDDEFIKKSMEAQAKYFWGNEYEAYKAQWGFMKRYQESRLMISRKDVAEKGEHKAWLDFFINILLETNLIRWIGCGKTFMILTLKVNLLTRQKNVHNEC